MYIYICTLKPTSTLHDVPTDCHPSPWRTLLPLWPSSRPPPWRRRPRPPPTEPADAPGTGGAPELQVFRGFSMAIPIIRWIYP